MAKQILKNGGAWAEAELRTTTTTANQVVTSIDLSGSSGGFASWNGAVFLVRGRVLSFEEDGGGDYTGIVEILARGNRRAGTLNLTNAINPNYDPTPILNGSTTVDVNFNVTGNTIQLRVSPQTAAAHNIRHFGRIMIEAYQFQ